MEGAVWMGRRICNEVENVCQAFERLQNEYQSRVKTAQSQSEIQRTQTWFCEAVKQSGFTLYENALNMLEAAIYHSGEQKQQQVDTEPQKLTAQDHQFTQSSHKAQ